MNKMRETEIIAVVKNRKERSQYPVGKGVHWFIEENE